MHGSNHFSSRTRGGQTLLVKVRDKICHPLCAALTEENLTHCIQHWLYTGLFCSDLREHSHPEINHLQIAFSHEQLCVRQNPRTKAGEGGCQPTNQRICIYIHIYVCVYAFFALQATRRLQVSLAPCCCSSSSNVPYLY